jgi:hypothetical protein
MVASFAVVVRRRWAAPVINPFPAVARTLLDE